MLQEVGFFEFCDAMGHKEFTGAGLRILYDYLDENYPAYVLDVIELNSGYVESTPDDIVHDYAGAPDEVDDDGEYDVAAIEAWLRSNTEVCGVTSTGAFVFSYF